MICGSASADKIPLCRPLALAHAVEQPAIANRERPFPELPQPRRPVGRKKDELGASDQVLGWDVADGGKHTAILRVVTIVTHHEVFAGWYIVDLSVVERTVVAHLNDPMLYAIRQGFDILGERDHRTIALVIEEILDTLAQTWLVVDVEDTVLHLDMIAGEADHPLDIIRGVVCRQLEHRHVAALG